MTTAASTYVANCARCKAAEANEPESFHFLTLEWDVDRAHRIIAGQPRNRVTLNVDQLAGSLGFIRIEAAHVGHVPTDQPLIIAQYTTGVGRAREGFSMPIDGWHRIARARRDDVAMLESYVLTLAESNACRLDRPSRGR